MYVACIKQHVSSATARADRFRPDVMEVSEWFEATRHVRARSQCQPLKKLRRRQSNFVSPEIYVGMAAEERI